MTSCWKRFCLKFNREEHYSKDNAKNFYIGKISNKTLLFEDMLWPVPRLGIRVKNMRGYIDVGDGCWRRNVLMTTTRCWWRYRPFLSPKSIIFLQKSRAKSFKRCHQHPKIVNDFKSPTPRCHQHRCHCWLWPVILIGLPLGSTKLEPNLKVSPIFWLQINIRCPTTKNLHRKILLSFRRQSKSNRLSRYCYHLSELVWSKVNMHFNLHHRSPQFEVMFSRIFLTWFV